MHFLTYVLIPASTPDPKAEVDALMGKYNSQEYKGGFWNWYQIGGRWTGFLSGYDPEKDPANIEGNYTKAGIVEKRVKWPTAWAKHDGDIQPAAVALAKDDVPNHLVTSDENVLAYETWNGHDWIVNAGYEEAVKLALEKAVAAGEQVVVVDCHD